MKKYLIVLSAFVLFASCERVVEFEINAPESVHNRAVGASAVELLSGDKYKSLVVEIAYMPGAAPDASALEHLKSFLNQYCSKPSGISVVTHEVPAASSSVLSANDLVKIEQDTRQEYSGNGRIVVYMLYTNGSFTTANVLGAAYQNTSAVLFGKTIQENSGGIGQPSRTKLEATVLAHELGHLLGLVDVGTPMQTAHKDPDHGNHCDDSNCLMYYASETTDVLGFLVTGNVPGLDDNCAADLKAAGGK